MPLLTEASPLVLGSASPRRREILDALLVPYRVQAGQANEEVRPGELAPGYLERIARAKLLAVVEALPPELLAAAPAILVADTSVVLGEEILGKPADVDEACSMIARLAGRSHWVMTRFVIAWIDGTEIHGETVVTRVSFRPLSDARIRAYAGSGEGLDKAGAYAVQGLGASLVSRIEGSFSNVVGLPACELIVALERLGLRD